MAVIINLFGDTSTSEVTTRKAAPSPTGAEVAAKPGNAMAVAKAMANGFCKPDAGPVFDAATVTRIALRWVRRRGRKMSSLPKLIRMELDEHCKAGDPTARLIRDWIEGKSPLALPPGSLCSGSTETPVPSGEAERGLR